MKESVDQCTFLLTLADKLLARLDDSHLALEPQPGAKTAGWLVGHLAVTGDFGRHLCGERALCQREWRTTFNPGSRPSTSPGDYPPMSVLRDTFRAVYESLAKLAPVADAARLAAPNPYEPARPDFPTIGDFVAYLLSGHLAYHLGQLSEWCAAAGVAHARAQDAVASQ
jgi:hypothetical protein